MRPAFGGGEKQQIARGNVSFAVGSQQRSAAADYAECFHVLVVVVIMICGMSGGISRPPFSVYRRLGIAVEPVRIV